ncbi:MAG: nucleotidyltransferase family protein [Actinobacteria bacterium]|nr:nucleotidyltransferase family protein [Actinomycetota bacterium]
MAGEAVRPGDLAGVAEAAAYHRVSGLVHRALSAAGGRVALPGDEMHRLEAAYHAAVRDHLRTLGDLSAAGSALDAAGVPWLVVKGPVLAERYYGSPGERAYGDVDLLVPRGAFPDAVDALEGAGMPVIDRNWRLLRAELRSQVHVELPLGTLADVHWHLVEPGRDPFELPVEAMIERSRPVSLGGQEVLTLDPGDTLLHLALHAALSGGHRLVWLKDVERAMASEPPDWDELVGRARAARAVRPLGVILRRVARTLGRTAPREVMRGVEGGALAKAVGRAIDRSSPPERSAGRWSLGQLEARVAGRGPVGGAVQALRLAGKIRPDRAARTYGHAILRPDGDLADRRAYLDAVRAHPRP